MKTLVAGPLANAKGTAKKKDESPDNAVATPTVDVDKLAKELAPKIAEELNVEGLTTFLKDHLTGMGYEDQEITPDLIMATYRNWPAEKRDPMLRTAGLVPTPSLMSSVSGWHHIEHMRAAGWRNKIAGFMGLFYQATAFALAAYLGVEWYRARTA